MAKRIVWTDQAIADVSLIDQSTALQILKILGRYARTGEGDTRQLQGVQRPMIRLRAGDYRIFFRDEGHLKINRVLHRKEAYR